MKSISRRQFNRAAVAAATVFGTAPAFLRGQNLNSKLNIAMIGTGRRGAANTQSVGSENIVALCGVNSTLLDAAAAKFPQAKRYADFRKMYDDARDFDAVVVSICEQTHAFATMLAIKNGKHVYCEKPLTHGVWEARQIRLAAEANPKVVTQMGIQMHSGANYHRVVEKIQAGIIGPVSEAHVWVSRAWGLQSEEASKRNKDVFYVTERPKEAQEPPPFLNWDLWLGPAPYRPYNDVYFPGPRWYRWWDFGSGTMSDLGSHWNDLPFWALKLDAPRTIQAKGDAPAHPELAPASFSATYEYGPRAGLPEVKVHWYQGEHKPEIWKSGGIPKWGDGVLFVGAKGMLLSDYNRHTLITDNQPGQIIKDAGPKPVEHHIEWLNACKGGPATLAPFSYGGPLTEANHLASIAYRLDKKLEWDAANLRCPNAPEADRLIHREYRKGWVL